MSVDEVSINTGDVSDFLVDGALMRSTIKSEYDEVVEQQAAVLRTSSFALGTTTWTTDVNSLLTRLKSSETFASESRGAFILADQQQQFDDAGVTISTDGTSFVLSVDSGEDDVDVVELVDGRLALSVNGEQIELTTEQSEDLKIETGGDDDTITVHSDVQTGITIDGGAGADQISGGSGDDTILGGSGHDTLRGGDGDDTIEGTSGDDTIWGGSGNDTLIGGSGDDTIHGGAGDDTIEGGFGGDKIYGNDGDDTIDGEAGKDFIYGNHGDDTIDGGASGDVLLGQEGDDWITGREGNDRVSGGSGDDVIFGNEGQDEVDGDGGDDSIYGSEGDDDLSGGDGDDFIRGGDGDDNVSGADGDDVIRGDDGDDTVFGGEGNDDIRGDDGEDYLEGQAGDDTIFGGDNIDVIYGSDGHDTLDGGEGADYIEGQTGDDTITGGDGNDQISGGEGDDNLDAGLGSDRVFTGTGDDTVEAGSADNVYATDDATVNGNPNNLTVRDPLEIPDNLVIDGPPEFQARVEADLAVLAQTDEGRKLLEDISESDNTLTIAPQDDESKGGTASSTNDKYYESDGSPGPGSDSTIRIHPDRVSDYVVGDGTSELSVPPIVTLVHEMVHSEQHLSGTMEPGESEEINLETGLPSGDGDTNSRELDAVGLEFVIDRDGDGTPDPGVTPPEHVTENSFREELGIENRTEY